MNSTQKYLLIACSAETDFGSRFQSLVLGLVLARKTNRVVVCRQWPETPQMTPLDIWHVERCAMVSPTRFTDLSRLAGQSSPFPVSGCLPAEVAEQPVVSVAMSCRLEQVPRKILRQVRKAYLQHFHMWPYLQRAVANAVDGLTQWDYAAVCAHTDSPHEKEVHGACLRAEKVINRILGQTWTWKFAILAGRQTALTELSRYFGDGWADIRFSSLLSETDPFSLAIGVEVARRAKVFLSSDRSQLNTVFHLIRGEPLGDCVSLDEEQRKEVRETCHFPLSSSASVSPSEKRYSRRS